VVTAVKTTETGGHRGLSFLVIEKGMEGFTVSRKLEKLGWHAWTLPSWPSTTCSCQRRTCSARRIAAST
jgi:hypothetical protein